MTAVGSPGRVCVIYQWLKRGLRAPSQMGHAREMGCQSFSSSFSSRRKMALQTYQLVGPLSWQQQQLGGDTPNGVWSKVKICFFASWKINNAKKRTDRFEKSKKGKSGIQCKQMGAPRFICLGWGYLRLLFSHSEIIVKYSVSLEGDSRSRNGQPTSVAFSRWWQGHVAE